MVYAKHSISSSYKGSLNKHFMAYITSSYHWHGSRNCIVTSKVTNIHCSQFLEKQRQPNLLRYWEFYLITQAFINVKLGHIELRCKYSFINLILPKRVRKNIFFIFLIYFNISAGVQIRQNTSWFTNFIL